MSPVTSFRDLPYDVIRGYPTYVTSFLVMLYMTLLPYLKMICDPLVYGVRMCRRTPAGVLTTSRAAYFDAASTAAVLRTVPTTSQGQ